MKNLLQFSAPVLAGLLVLSVSRPAGAEPFPEPVNTEPAKTSATQVADLVSTLKLPPGFQATVFAAEPDVQQPIAMAFDARGRLWVAENYTYPERKTDETVKARDRILVFEDTDNDGHFDKRTVFWEGARHLTGLAVGLGGVWALDLPRLVFIPDADMDAVPDDAPQVVLDGFDLQKAGHTMANGLKFGPDGWLYGREGILADSLVGRPGSPDTERVRMGAAIWRVHPVTHRCELVAQGTTNPWGMDWNEVGEPFFINTVIGHLWHVIPGAHYRRMFGADPDPHVYRLIEQHADHFHWDTNEQWMDVRKLGVTDASSKTGGGHAHTGLMIYQGDNWPAEYRGKLFTINFHGRRLNSDLLEREGSGYVGKHGADAVSFGDPWFRGIDLASGSDGGVFVLDWSDTGECHDHDGVHRTSGRIYKITHGTPQKPAVADVAKASDEQLVALQNHPNEWFGRESRLEMRRRALSGADVSAIRNSLLKLHAQEGDARAHLRALWGLQALGSVPKEVLRASLGRADENEQAWAIRLLADNPTGVDMTADVIAALQTAATGRTSPLTRLTLASVAQKIPVAERASVLRPLLAHAEDADDHNLPLMLWFAAIPLAESAPDSLVALASGCEIPLTRRYMARRLAEELERQPKLVADLLAVAAGKSAPFQHDILSGIGDGLTGWRQAPKPANWDTLRTTFSGSADESVKQATEELAAMFGDGEALAVFRKVALDEKRDGPVRRAALRVLVDRQAPGLRELCEKLFEVRDLSVTASGGLSLSDDPTIADFMIARFNPLNGDERYAAVATMATRLPWSERLLRAVASGDIPKSSINANVARQIRSFGDAATTQQLESLVGRLGAASGDKVALVKKWKSRLTPATLAGADRVAGKVVFNSICGACHRLNGEGGQIGPDLTGGQRDNLDYLLENLADPSAVVPPEFRLSTVTMKDGRVLAGAIKSRSERSLALQTPTETLTLAQAEVNGISTSPRSLMPDGLLEALSETQIRDLIAYMMQK